MFTNNHKFTSTKRNANLMGSFQGAELAQNAAKRCGTFRVEFETKITILDDYGHVIFIEWPYRSLEHVINAYENYKIFNLYKYSLDVLLDHTG